jgi:hypothetical protein
LPIVKKLTDGCNTCQDCHKIQTGLSRIPVYPDKPFSNLSGGRMRFFPSF